ncbi:MAG: class I SAM-dependent methyltransferase [Vicingaceae bacterium]
MSFHDYIKVNRAAWDKRTAVHVKSKFYDMASFKSGQTSLKNIELELIGNVAKKDILHLQCHFGQDSISLSRLGAKVTGVDFSEVAIKKANEIATAEGAKCDFICCDVYELENHLSKKYDIVYTTYGTIGWLPDLDKWAAIVSSFLKPGGQLVFVEFHPVFWMFDNNQEKVQYNYFNDSAIREVEEGTYADKSADLNEEYVTWNHNIAEVLTSLLNAGMEITGFNEYDYSPYKIFNNASEFEEGKFRVEHLGRKLPLVYSILATKK